MQGGDVQARSWKEFDNSCHVFSGTFKCVAPQEAQGSEYPARRINTLSPDLVITENLIVTQRLEGGKKDLRKTQKLHWHDNLLKILFLYFMAPPAGYYKHKMEWHSSWKRWHLPCIFTKQRWLFCQLLSLTHTLNHFVTLALVDCTCRFPCQRYIRFSGRSPLNNSRCCHTYEVWQTLNYVEFLQRFGMRKWYFGSEWAFWGGLCVCISVHADVCVLVPVCPMYQLNTTSSHFTTPRLRQSYLNDPFLSICLSALSLKFP